jgi:hypothetical protein
MKQPHSEAAGDGECVEGWARAWQTGDRDRDGDEDTETEAIDSPKTAARARALTRTAAPPVAAGIRAHATGQAHGARAEMGPYQRLAVT